MTAKRLILIVLTAITLIPLFSNLWASFQEPQIQGQLELYQTNLVLQAAEYDRNSASATSPEAIAVLVEGLTGEDPYDSAAEQYNKVLASSQANLQLLQQKKQTQPSIAASLDKTITETEVYIDELSLKLGILYAVSDNPAKAQAIWTKIPKSDSVYFSLRQILEPLWLEQRVKAGAEAAVSQGLDGWFLGQNLAQLYQIQDRQTELDRIQLQIQNDAQEAFLKLTIITILPFSVGIFGLGLLVFLTVQLARQRQAALLYAGAEDAWMTPWDGETVWQVFIVGFFLVGQIVLPLTLPFLFKALQLDVMAWTVREKALYTLVTYVVMAIAGLGVLWVSVRQFFPLPKDWFQFRWLDNWTVWGIGGYMVALPLVLIVSLINQQIWQGQGGSNPILFLALKAQDQVALTIFFLTASAMAPFFEEIMFRGFLLPSLTRYLPVWGSIVLSAFLFAIAHLSLSEILPLMTLGIVLGFVYVKSRNLLAPMLLHSLWNSGTLLSLFILGS